MINESINYEIVPEYYVGYDDPPVHITIHAKESYLATRKSVITSIFTEAIRKIMEAGNDV